MITTERRPDSFLLVIVAAATTEQRRYTGRDHAGPLILLNVDHGPH